MERESKMPSSYLYDQ
ncbi:hypothetical protein [Shigella flexneri]|nr:hypothetical protein [Shigella flexneri]